MLSCSRIDVAYGKGRNAVRPLRGLTADFPAEASAVMGPSGSGKSTLLRVLGGIQEPTKGEVRLDGDPVRADRGRTLHHRMAMVHQEPHLVDFLTVSENLRLAAELRRIRVASARVEQCLDAVGLAGFGRRAPGTLSGGEQQRVAIARALVLQSRVLLADEPTGSLDEANSVVVAELLRDLAREQGVVVLVATHDPTVARILPRTLRLSSGSLEAVA